MSEAPVRRSGELTRTFLQLLTLGGLSRLFGLSATSLGILITCLREAPELAARRRTRELGAR